MRAKTRVILTEAAYSSIELEPGGTVERQSIGGDPLAGVGRQLAALKTSVVEKPAARQVVRLRAQTTTHCPGRVSHFDDVKHVRNHSNLIVQQVLVASFCRKSYASACDTLDDRAFPVSKWVNLYCAKIKTSQCAAISKPQINVLSDVAYTVHLPQSSQQTVPHARSCDSEASVAESCTRAWNSECSVGRWAEISTTMEALTRPSDRNVLARESALWV